MILSPSILYVGFFFFSNEQFTHMAKITTTDACSCARNIEEKTKSSGLCELAQRSVSWQYKGVALFSNLPGKNYLLFCLATSDRL